MKLQQQQHPSAQTSSSRTIQDIPGLKGSSNPSGVSWMCLRVSKAPKMAPLEVKRQLLSSENLSEV